VIPTAQNRALYTFFALFTAVATFLLIGLGGLVTSKGVGMAVPDWPTTYGYNMFLFPVRLWTGGILYEHTHRLFASFVGLLTTILAVWMWIKEPRRWLRWLGVAAFFAVVLQGVLGGLRVTQYSNELGVLHGALAQMFFVMISLIVLYGSGLAQRLSAEARQISKPLAYLIFGTTVLVFLQLGLGAMMRHQHAGLAVPDFPLAYGRLWPPMTPEFAEMANRQRMEAIAYNAITPFHIGLHMAHRIGALLLLGLVAVAALRIRAEQGPRNSLARLGYSWVALVLFQAALGALTIWTNKSVHVATTHVLVGALTLLAGVVLSAAAMRLREGSLRGTIMGPEVPGWSPETPRL
jgi:heme a synthase